MKRILPLALLALASCYGADKFEEEYFDARCDWRMACYPDNFTGPEVCEGQLPAGDEGLVDCEFDDEAAKACVDAWEAMTCPDGEEMPVFPDVCDEVYRCAGEADTDTDTDT